MKSEINDEKRYCRYCGYYNIDSLVIEHEWKEHFIEIQRKGRSNNQ